MESKKIILMNLFAGQEYRRIENRLVGPEGKREGGTIERVALKHIYYHMQNK